MSLHSPSRVILGAASLVGGLCLHAPAIAVTVTLGASKDNTIFQHSNSVSSGLGPYLYVGQTNPTFGDRRALIQFDLTSIPANSIVTSVSLSMHASKRGPNYDNEFLTLTPLSFDWGEGTSASGIGGVGGTGGGQGAPASANDVTWSRRFFGNAGSSWNNPGGDFAATPTTGVNAPLPISGIGTITWPSTPSFVQQVQAWINNPTTNFGWIIRGDETTTTSAVRLDSRNNTVAAFRPALTVTYTPPGIPGDANGDSAVDGRDMAIVVANLGRTNGASLSLGDLNNDLKVSVLDLAFWRNAKAAASSPQFAAAPPIPEPSTLILALCVAIAGMAVARQRRARVAT